MVLTVQFNWPQLPGEIVPATPFLFYRWGVLWLGELRWYAQGYIVRRKSNWGDIPVLLTTEPCSFLNTVLPSQMLLGLIVLGLIGWKCSFGKVYVAVLSRWVTGRSYECDVIPSCMGSSASPGGSREMLDRIWGCILDLLNQIPHWNQIPSDLYAH